MAAGIAHGIEVSLAAFNAQEFTWNALNKAIPLNIGQCLPDRRR
jgi:hypothetical protein